MLSRLTLLLAACAALVWYAKREPAPRDYSQGLSGLGINLAGAEFGVDRGLSNTSPGVPGLDYTYNGARTTRAVAAAGLRFIRLPFRWERIQPELGGPLDPNELGRLEAAVAIAQRHGLAVLLDLHNYGRYHTRRGSDVVEAVIDRSYRDRVLVTRDRLADVWRRLAARFVDWPAVVGYGLMNEPHDLDGSDWKAISQAAVDAIREVDQETRIVVAGNEWSAADRFTAINGPETWIVDPAGNTAYEAHAYFDHDGSGEYALDYEEELRRDSDLPLRGAQRVADFLGWLERNRVPGILGEVGVPTHDPAWRPLLVEALHEANRRGVPVALWAAGEWWGEYPLSLQGELLGDRPAATLEAALAAAAEERD